MLISIKINRRKSQVQWSATHPSHQTPSLMRSSEKIADSITQSPRKSRLWKMYHWLMSLLNPRRKPPQSLNHHRMAVTLDRGHSKLPRKNKRLKKKHRLLGERWVASEADSAAASRALEACWAMLQAWLLKLKMLSRRRLKKYKNKSRSKRDWRPPRSSKLRNRRKKRQRLRPSDRDNWPKKRQKDRELSERGWNNNCRNGLPLKNWPKSN